MAAAVFSYTFNEHIRAYWIQDTRPLFWAEGIFQHTLRMHDCPHQFNRYLIEYTSCYVTIATSQPEPTTFIRCAWNINTSWSTLFQNLPVISVFLGFINWPIMDMMSCPPCGRALAQSKSWSVTSWTTSFFLWTSPFGRGTYSSA